MERYIGLDVHAASTTVAIVSQSGKRLKNFPVETNGRALVEAIRLIPGRKHVVLEEGTQSAWLHEVLTPHAEEVVVAGVIYSRGQKTMPSMRTSWPRSCARGHWIGRSSKAPGRLRCCAS